MLIFYNELTLEEGFEVLSKPKEDRLVRGRKASPASGLALFQHLHALGKPIRCFNCFCKADRWILDRGKTDMVGSPVLNLYGTRRGKMVLINRDHIIPKSLGGVDAVQNLRAACDVCNMKRGNKLTDKDLKFRAKNQHLIDEDRLQRGIEKAKCHIQKLLLRPGNEEVIKEIMIPFQAIGISF